MQGTNHTLTPRKQLKEVSLLHILRKLLLNRCEVSFAEINGCKRRLLTSQGLLSYGKEPCCLADHPFLKFAARL